VTLRSRNVRRSLLLILAALAGCSERAPRAAAALDAAVAPAADAAPVSKVAELVPQLRDGDDELRMKVIGRIAALAVQKTLTAPEGLEVLEVIPAISPATQGPAIDAVFLHAHPGYVAAIERLAPRLAPEGRSRALVALARGDDPAAHALIVALLEAHASEPQPRLFVQLSMTPRPVVFPELLRLAANPALRDPIFATAIDYCNRKQVRAATLAVHADVVLARWRELLPAVTAAQQPGTDLAWRWADDYRPLRDEAGVLLDLLGCLPRKQVEKELKAALQLADPRLKLVAARALVYVRARPSRAALELIAADPETRAALYRTLVRAGKKRMFPKKWRDQASLAASMLVERLSDEDLLGRPPDELELLDVVAFDAGKPTGILDTYVFRFRVAEPHPKADRDWMLGLAGPFRRKSAPTLDDHGGTDSELAKARGTHPAKKVDPKQLKAAWEAEEAPEAWENETPE
jgi:hypothetical protein